MRTACTYNTCAGAPHVRMGFIEILFLSVICISYSVIFNVK